MTDKEEDTMSIIITWLGVGMLIASFITACYFVLSEIKDYNTFIIKILFLLCLIGIGGYLTEKGLTLSPGIAKRKQEEEKSNRKKIKKHKKKEDSLLQALLQEYANAVQLYTNTIAVTYTRVYGFLAIHGALIVGFFFLPEHRFLISCVGLALAIATILTIEHVWQFSILRITQVREIEERLNQLIKADENFKLTTFKNQKTLFIDKKGVTFPLINETLPKSFRAWVLIKFLPHQADRIVTYLLGVGWLIATIFNYLNAF